MSTIELGELLSINQGNTDKIEGHESPEDLEKKLDSMIKDENDTITFDLSPFDKEDRDGDVLETLCVDHVISTRHRMTNSVSNFECLF